MYRLVGVKRHGLVQACKRDLRRTDDPWDLLIAHFGVLGKTGVKCNCNPSRKCTLEWCVLSNCISAEYRYPDGGSGCNIGTFRFWFASSRVCTRSSYALAYLEVIWNWVVN